MNEVNESTEEVKVGHPIEEKQAEIAKVDEKVQDEVVPDADEKKIIVN